MIKKATRQNRTKKRFTDLVGIDFSTTDTKVVRLKQNKSDLALAGMDILPAVDFGLAANRVELPRTMTTNYSCLAYSGPAAVVRMVSAQMQSGEDTLPEKRIRELLNVTDDFRVSAQLITAGKGRHDSSLLAAAIPQDDLKFLLNMFPSGPPAPASIEVSGLAFISAFLHARRAECADHAVCLVDAGETMTHFVFLNKGEVVLVGKMPFGARTLRNRIASDLGVDEDIAESILSDRSINISASLTGAMDALAKQLTISRDFIERHQGFRVSKVYLSGGVSLYPNWTAEVGRMLNSEITLWSPFENIQCDDDTLPEEMKRQATRFAAAVGAAIGGFEEA